MLWSLFALASLALVLAALITGLPTGPFGPLAGLLRSTPVPPTESAVVTAYQSEDGSGRLALEPPVAPAPPGGWRQVMIVLNRDELDLDIYLIDARGGEAPEIGPRNHLGWQEQSSPAPADMLGRLKEFLAPGSAADVLLRRSAEVGARVRLWIPAKQPPAGA